MADGQSRFQTDSEWAERSQFWISQTSKSQPKRPRRERQTAPLILTGHGLSIRVDKSCLLIRDGNTHYPAEKRELRYFKGSLDIPPRIVLIDGSGNISIDAIDWMTEQSISLVRISYGGSNASILSPNGFAADPRRGLLLSGCTVSAPPQWSICLPESKRTMSTSPFFCGDRCGRAFDEISPFFLARAQLFRRCERHAP